MMTHRKLMIFLLLCATALALQAQGFPDIKLELVEDGFDAPLYVISDPRDASRLFVVEQTGRIWVIDDGELISEPFLDISERVSTGGERGLLSMAFHPEFRKNRFFYVYYTDVKGDTVVSRFRVRNKQPNEVKVKQERIILRFKQPFANHNGGQMQIGPDDCLYIGTGDGGSGGDPEENAQDLNSPLGKMLRICVDRFPYCIPHNNPFVDTEGLGIIWSYGLRNPWRFSFDRKTGDLWIGDVGQNTVEEVDFQPRGSAGGENYGWDQMEGSRRYEAAGNEDLSGYVLPVYEYDRATGYGRSITGGYVYRGSAIPGLDGYYIFGDFSSGKIFCFKLVNKTPTNFRELTGQLTPPGGGNLLLSSFGEDADGELYVCDFVTGGVYKIVPR
jgi:glucose/arabinose dehydrogenase